MLFDLDFSVTSFSSPTEVSRPEIYCYSHTCLKAQLSYNLVPLVSKEAEKSSSLAQKPIAYTRGSIAAQFSSLKGSATHITHAKTDSLRSISSSLYVEKYVFMNNKFFDNCQSLGL